MSEQFGSERVDVMTSTGDKSGIEQHRAHAREMVIGDDLSACAGFDAETLPADGEDEGALFLQCGFHASVRVEVESVCDQDGNASGLDDGFGDLEFQLADAFSFWPLFCLDGLCRSRPASRKPKRLYIGD
ncbi:hypothetical protein MAP00_004938 [Monascus purpureus]|nr:hypothetical protein MAP00_004938 [Monascus purpureus]